jgi:hypothetical protein
MPNEVGLQESPKFANLKPSHRPYKAAAASARLDYGVGFRFN